MCHSYFYTKHTTEKVINAFGIGGFYVPEGDKTVLPGSSAYMISGTEGKLSVKEGVWGFPSKSGLVINARAETALLKPMFSSSVLNRRCILPAESFYEWDHDKNKVSFRVPDADVIYLAGFWNLFGDEKRFVVLTTAANASMLPVHDRMPLMVTKNNVEPWLFNEKDAQCILKSEMPELISSREFEQMSLFS